VSDAAPPQAGTLRIGRVLGVPVELGASWFLLAALVVVSYGPVLGRAQGSTQGYLSAAAFALLLLVSVLLHEVGHCVAARLLRLRVRRISVSFLAGMTEITDPPPTPARAFSVSVSGPLVSVLLAGVGWLARESLPYGSASRQLAGLFAVSNGGLAVFNLLPGLPLDGGGVLRALVWRVTGSASTGTLVGAHVGRVLAVLLVPLSVLVVAPLLGGQLSVIGIVTSAFVALFLYAGSTAALRGARVEGRLRGVGAGALARPALLVPATLPLGEALRRAHAARLHAMIVVDTAGRPLGLVSEAAVIAVPEERRPWIPVGELSRTLEAGLVLDPALTGGALVEAVRRTPASEYLVPGPEPRVLVAADLASVANGPRQAVA
jgi:Zn-dependent protease